MFRSIQRTFGPVSLLLSLGSSLAVAEAQSVQRIYPWRVTGQTKIASNQGGFSGLLVDDDFFGLALAATTDLNGDGRPELVVGAPGEDTAGSDSGSLYVLFLNADGSVGSQQQITQGVGGFTGFLDVEDYFGRGVWSLGDLDNDGNEDLIVGSYRDDDGAIDAGAAYVLFMNANGTVRSHQKISNTSGGFTGSLGFGDLFGVRVCGIGDLDGDGVEDAVVAASFDDDGGTDRGAIYVLFLNTNGTVKAQQKLSETAGGLGIAFDDLDYFGTSIAPIGDLDGDGVVDLAVGARGDDDGANGSGCVYIVFLNTNGTAKATSKISDTAGGFRGGLQVQDNFGLSLVDLGDRGGTGRRSIAVGAFRDDDGGLDRGAVWVLDLASDGSVLSHVKLSSTRGALGGGGAAPGLQDNDNLGTGLTVVPDLDGDGEAELAIGAWNDTELGQRGGSTYLCRLSSRPSLSGAGPAAPAAPHGSSGASQGTVLAGSVSLPERADEPLVTGVLVGRRLADGEANVSGLRLAPPFEWFANGREMRFSAAANGLGLFAQSVAIYPSGPRFSEPVPVSTVD